MNYLKKLAERLNETFAFFLILFLFGLASLLFVNGMEYLFQINHNTYYNLTHSALNFLGSIILVNIVLFINNNSKYGII